MAGQIDRYGQKVEWFGKMYQSKIQSQEDGKQKDFRCRCLYTDDTQLYLFIESSSLDQSVQITQSCMKGIDDWMTINNLKILTST